MNFQSSFYKDTLWNLTRFRPGQQAHQLSILILQGHSLKRCILQRYYLRFPFQSSFYKDTLWNQSKRLQTDKLDGSFNPHFTRTLSETHSHAVRRAPRYVSFNPHFTRTLSETRAAFSPVMPRPVYTFNPHFTRTLSETWRWMANCRSRSIFQSSFYKDTLWNSYALRSRHLLPAFQSSFYKDTLWNIRLMLIR